jgi:hypothetical protein
MAKFKPKPMAGMPDPLLGLSEIRHLTKDIPRRLGGQPSEHLIRRMLDDGTIKGCVRDQGGERKVPCSAVISWMQSLKSRKAKAKEPQP